MTIGMNELVSASKMDQPTGKLSVYFDGACPLCRREIGAYRQMRGADAISWIDVSTSDDGDLAADLTKYAALRRFHVRRSDGNLAGGAEAFAELWIALPSLTWLGRFLTLLVIRHGAERLYRFFLLIRPILQKSAS